MADVTKLEVKGMSCVGCSNAVTNQLKSLGMQEVFVDFTSGEVRFVNAPGAPDQQIIDGIQNLGYTVVQDDDSKKKTWTIG